MNTATNSKIDWKQIAANSVEVIGIACIVYGLYIAMALEHVSGIWLAMFGLVALRLSAEYSTEHEIHRVLGGHRVSEFIETESMTFDPLTPLAALMRNPLHSTDQLVFPVARETDHEFLGVVDVRNTNVFPPSEWNSHIVAEITRPYDQDLIVEPEADAETTLLKMRTLGLKELLVVRKNRLLGVLRQSTLLQRLQQGLQVPGGMQTT